MLNQLAEDRNETGVMLHISETQQNYIKNADSGQGLIYNGKAIVPFINKFPYGNLLYRVISTNPNDQMDCCPVRKGEIFLLTYRTNVCIMIL